MSLSRDDVAASRVARWAGLLGGVLVFAMMRPLNHDSFADRHHSVFFGDMTKWPSFMKGFWPLDLAVVCLSFWLVLYLILISMRKRGTEGRFWIIKYAAGVFVGFGCFGSVIGATLEGWYRGLEFFLLMGLFVTIFGGGLIAVSLGLLAAGTFVAPYLERFWVRVRGQQCQGQ